MNVIVFLLCHLVGDYILQSDWMALNKSKKSLNCLVHVLIYTACFLVLTTSWQALFFIGATHFILDRWPVIIRRIIWLKNHIPTGKYAPWTHCDSTGYYDDSPYNSRDYTDYKALKEYTVRHFYITIWLYIITDNILHLICNAIALGWIVHVL